MPRCPGDVNGRAAPYVDAKASVMSSSIVKTTCAHDQGGNVDRAAAYVGAQCTSLKLRLVDGGTEDNSKSDSDDEMRATKCGTMSRRVAAERTA